MVDISQKEIRSGPRGKMVGELHYSGRCLWLKRWREIRWHYFVTVLFINELNLSRLKIDSLSGPYLVYFYCWAVCCYFLHLKLSQVAQADTELPSFEFLISYLHHLGKVWL